MVNSFELEKIPIEFYGKNSKYESLEKKILAMPKNVTKTKSKVRGKSSSQIFDPVGFQYSKILYK